MNRRKLLGLLAALVPCTLVSRAFGFPKRQSPRHWASHVPTKFYSPCPAEAKWLDAHMMDTAQMIESHLNTFLEIARRQGVFPTKFNVSWKNDPYGDADFKQGFRFYVDGE